MDWPQCTRYTTVALVVAAVTYNIAARILGGNEATISYQVQAAVYKWPVIAGAIGLLAGHWLWPVK